MFPLKYLEKRSPWILAGILMASFTIRNVCIQFGLPNHFRPDEEVLVGTPIKFGQTGDFNPHVFSYPSLHYYVLFLVDWIYLKIIHLTHAVDIETLWTIYTKDHLSTFYLLARLTSVIMGTLTVWILWRIARENFSFFHALLSAGFLGIVFLHVRDSHFATNDVPCTLWLVCAFWMSARILRDGKKRDYWLAGLFTGLATATKYNAGIVILTVLCAHFFYTHSVKDPAQKKKQSLFLAESILCMILCFALINFPIFFELPNFINDVAVVSEHLQGGHYGVKLGFGWIYHLIFTFPNGLGWGLYILSIGGFLLALYRRNKMDWLILSFTLPYFFYLGYGYTVFLRYMIPIIPFLIMLGVNCLEIIYTSISRYDRKILYFIFSLILVYSVLPTLGNSLRFDYLLKQKDTREVSADWIEKNIPAGAKIALSGMFGHPPLPYKGKHDLYLFGGYRMDIVQFDQPLVDLMVMNKKIEYIVADYHPVIYSIPLRKPGDFEPGKCIATFSPLKDPAGTIQSSDFDLIDAFYVPYRHLWKYERPGPLIKIYTLKH